MILDPAAGRFNAPDLVFKGKTIPVEAVLVQWFDREHIFFKVRADDGNHYTSSTKNIDAGGSWELV